MAESAPDAAPGSPTGGPASLPPVLPLLAVYTLGRLAIAVALIALLWFLLPAPLGGIPAMLFGLLLSMPVAYLLLRPVRERLTEALAARSIARKQAKLQLRSRLTGTEADD